MNSGTFRPFRQTQRFSIKSDMEIRSLVALLLFACRPSTIALLVIPISVGESVDRVFAARTQSHVVDEVLERVTPSVADCDAATTVMPKIRTPWVEATLIHLNPCRQFRKFRSSCCRTMLCESEYDVITSKTTTAFRATVKQLAANDNGSLSTLTITKPNRLMKPIASLVTLHGQTTKCLPGEVVKPLVCWQKCFSHDMNLSSQGLLRLKPARRDERRPACFIVMDCHSSFNLKGGQHG